MYIFQKGSCIDITAVMEFLPVLASTEYSQQISQYSHKFHSLAVHHIRKTLLFISYKPNNFTKHLPHYEKQWTIFTSHLPHTINSLVDHHVSAQPKVAFQQWPDLDYLFLDIFNL